MLFNHPDIWIIIGIVFIIFETFMAPGIGFLFAGLAAFTTGIFIKYNILEYNLYLELACFLGFSVFWGLILWYPLKKIMRKSKDNKIQNIIGDKAIIYGSNLEPNKLGKVKWSGTIMNARLAQEISEIKPVDSEVEIVEITGNILIVK